MATTRRELEWLVMLSKPQEVSIAVYRRLPVLSSLFFESECLCVMPARQYSAVHAIWALGGPIAVVSRNQAEDTVSSQGAYGLGLVTFGHGAQVEGPLPQIWARIAIDLTL